MATPPHHPHPARTAALALFLLTTLNLFNFIDRYVLPGVQPLIQREFHINDAQTGLLTSAFFFTYMLIAPLTGWLGDRFPRKPLIVAGALIWSAATLLTATVHSYHTLLIRHAAVGIGEATFSIFAPALLADFYPEEDRNRVLSIFYVTIPVGGALGYLLGGVLGERYGWRMPFYVAAAPGVLIALAFWLFVREPQRGAADTLQAHRRPRQLHRPLPQLRLPHRHPRHGHVDLRRRRHLHLAPHLLPPLRRLLRRRSRPHRR